MELGFPPEPTPIKKLGHREWLPATGIPCPMKCPQRAWTSALGGLCLALKPLPSPHGPAALQAGPSRGDPGRTQQGQRAPPPGSPGMQASCSGPRGKTERLWFLNCPSAHCCQHVQGGPVRPDARASHTLVEGRSRGALCDYHGERSPPRTPSCNLATGLSVLSRALPTLVLVLESLTESHFK